jgi:hypothetical protein
MPASVMLTPGISCQAPQGGSIGGLGSDLQSFGRLGVGAPDRSRLEPDRHLAPPTRNISADFVTASTLARNLANVACLEPIAREDGQA